MITFDRLDGGSITLPADQVKGMSEKEEPGTGRVYTFMTCDDGVFDGVKLKGTLLEAVKAMARGD